MESNQIFEATDLTLHDHCLHCIFPLRCQYLLPENQLGCRVIRCPQECEAKFHSCKTEEHLFLCPQLKIPCINQGYGCPIWLKRSEINAHLANCPASVIYCSAEWNRKPLSQLAKISMKKEARKPGFKMRQNYYDKTCRMDVPPDVAFALSDQSKIQEGYRLQRSVRNRSTNFFNRCHPQLPLIREHGSEDYLDHGPSAAVDSSDEEEAEEKLKFQKGLSPVMRECRLCKIDPGSQHLHVLGSGDHHWLSTSSATDETKQSNSDNNTPTEELGPNLASVFPEIYANHGLYMTLSPDFLPRTVKKHRKFYTLVCSQSVRRDEFFWHYKNLHNDIINSIDGWSFFRCPFMDYGCKELYSRVVPHGKLDRKIRYNSGLDSFTVSVRTPGILFKNPRSLAELPQEILLDILSYLDGASLLCLAVTCKILRDICEAKLSQKGIVEQKWVPTIDRRGRISWVQGPFMWSFSKCFHPIPNWLVQNNAQYLNHLPKCREDLGYKVYTKDRISVLHWDKDSPPVSYCDHFFTSKNT